MGAKKVLSGPSTGCAMHRLEPEFTSTDSRRVLQQLLTADIKQVNVYEANYGAELGGHYHKETVEYFYVLSGVMKYNEHLVVKKGDIFYPEIGEMHTLKVVSDKAKFMTFLTQKYNHKDPDIHV